jgi:hypothetical protein
MRIALQIEEGEGFKVEATVLVPTLRAGEQWLLPNFLGLTGFLERVRFAVDPG